MRRGPPSRNRHAASTPRRVDELIHLVDQILHLLLVVVTIRAHAQRAHAIGVVARAAHGTRNGVVQIIERHLAGRAALACRDVESELQRVPAHRHAHARRITRRQRVRRVHLRRAHGEDGIDQGLQPVELRAHLHRIDESAFLGKVGIEGHCLRGVNQSLSRETQKS